LPPMPDRDPEVERLIAELRAWCKAKHGRNTQIAEMLGVYRQLVSDWLSGNATPTLAAGLKLQAFLKKRRPRHQKNARGEEILKT
jgi:transcriptional regulator with XRE-family HTH domain